MTTDYFKKTRESAARLLDPRKRPVPDGKIKCKKCGSVLDIKQYGRNAYVCPYCDAHDRLRAHMRIKLTADKNSFHPLFEQLKPTDPLHFPGYAEKIAQLQEKSGLNDAVITGTCTIGGIPVCIGAMDSYFMMASMGSVVGEKITRLFEYAAENQLPLILFACSGGARMQEGMFSLMQMAKTSGAAAKLSEAGQLYISVLTDPTTGGVTASFAMLGDIILAEPSATIGFAGRRVIEGTIGETLPQTFQTAEFTQENGFCDRIVPRSSMRSELEKLLMLHGYTRR